MVEVKGNGKLKKGIEETKIKEAVSHIAGYIKGNPKVKTGIHFQFSGGRKL